MQDNNKEKQQQGEDIIDQLTSLNQSNNFTWNVQEAISQVNPSHYHRDRSNVKLKIISEKKMKNILKTKI